MWRLKFEAEIETEKEGGDWRPRGGCDWQARGAMGSCVAGTHWWRCLRCGGDAGKRRREGGGEEGGGGEGGGGGRRRGEGVWRHGKGGGRGGMDGVEGGVQGMGEPPAFYGVRPAQ